MIAQKDKVDVITSPQRRRMVTSTRGDYSLQQILCHEESFTLFMQALSHEFSQEILLSFVEMIQYQQLIAEYINHNMDSNGKTLSSLTSIQSDNGVFYEPREHYEAVAFPCNVPKSYIIYGPYDRQSKALSESMDLCCDQNEFMELLKAAASKIWFKYIASNATWQINVPFSTQKALQTQMDCAHSNAMELRRFIH